MPNSTIFNHLASVTVSRYETWLASHVHAKRRTCALLHLVHPCIWGMSTICYHCLSPIQVPKRVHVLFASVCDRRPLPIVVPVVSARDYSLLPNSLLVLVVAIS